jgi:hypothetical protein
MVLRTAQFQIGSEIVYTYIMFNFLVAEEVSGHASLQAHLQLLYIDGPSGREKRIAKQDRIRRNGDGGRIFPARYP